MPVYEYYCPTCSTKFEKLRSIAVADTPVTCAAGHENTRKLISVFAVGSRMGDDSFSMPSGGGCACGGACSCGG